MNILYCGDAGIRDGVLISILSLLMNGEKHDTDATELNAADEKHKTPNNRVEKNLYAGPPEYNIYIATVKYGEVKPFPEKAAKFLDGLVKQYNSKSFVKLIDATGVFEKDLPSKNMRSYFTPCSMLRLYADKMPEVCGLDRVLYLDYDVVCRRDIREFYETNLDGVEVAGMLDIYGRRWYHYHGLVGRLAEPEVRDERPADERIWTLFKEDYMNSGVMLFNMPLCIKNRVFRQAVKHCVEKWSFLADQAALNRAIRRRKLMSRRYNEQEERPRENTVLHHFSNNFKFWPYFRMQKVKPHEIEKVHKVLKITEYDDILEEYMKLKDNL